MVMLLHSVAVQNQDPAADAVLMHDLPVNPLSVVLICLRPLNNTGTLVDFQQYVGICDAINNVSVLFRGQALVSMTGRDAAMMAYMRHGVQVFQSNADDTDDDRRCVVLPIVLGRRPYDPVSCFPATRRGELTLELDVDVADTGYDDLQYTVETVELLDATPREYEKQVQLALTPNATGLNDIDLPLGNLFRGLLLFATTPFGGAAPAPSWGRLELLLGNREIAYSSIDIEVANTLHGLLGVAPPAWETHTHRVDATAAVATEETTAAEELHAITEQYAFLPFDVSADDAFSIETGGASRFHLRADIETADAIRVVPVERVLVS